MKDPGRAYQQFIEFEEQAAAIYLKMAARFDAENSGLSALWLEMGMQEKQHAGLLQFCLLEKLFAEEGPTEEQIRDLRDEFAILAKRAEAPGLTVIEAFEIAVRMEASEVNAIYSHLTTPMHASIYLWKKKILASLPDHVGRLLAEGRKHGVPESLLAKIAPG